jgi:hypothetical protein
MFRPKWPSSGVQVVVLVVQDSAAEYHLGLWRTKWYSYLHLMSGNSSTHEPLVKKTGVVKVELYVTQVGTLN